jgi:hypothetical protein
MGIFPFHYNNSKAVDVLANAFIDGGIEKWKECAMKAMDCCNNMKQEDLNPGIQFEFNLEREGLFNW